MTQVSPLVSSAAIQEALIISFADGVFRRAERDYTPTLDEIEELGKYQAIGRYKSFPAYLASPKNFRTSAQSNVTSTPTVRTQINMTEVPVEVMGFLVISELLKNVGSDGGSTLNVSEITQQMKDLLKDVNQFVQRMVVASHGTSQIGVVRDAVVASTTVFLAAPYFTRAVMQNDKVDFYTSDSGGSPVAGATGVVINEVDNDNLKIILDTAITCSAGATIYITGSYGTKWNGMQGCIDNGVYATSLHNQSRTTYPKLKAKVKDITSGGLPQTLEENHITVLLQKIYDDGGMPSRCKAGPGWAQQYLGITTNDRRYPVAPGKSLKTSINYKPEDLMITTGFGEIPYKPDPNCDARTAYFYAPDNFRVLNALKIGWWKNAELMPLPNGNGYSTDSVAVVCGQKNLLCLEPWRTGALRGWRDQFAAGDAL